MKNKYVIGLAALPLSVACCMHANALESLDDKSLASVSGQDGIVISTEMTQASIDQVTFVDGNLNADGTVAADASGSLVFGKTNLSDASQKAITINPTGGNSNVTSKITLETGSSVANAPALNATLGLGPANIQVPNLSLCAADGSECKTLGALSVVNSGSQTQFSLVTTNGLFNEQGTAQLKAVIDDMTVAIKQSNNNGSGEVANQLMLGNMFANMTADGRLFVNDAKGLQFIGTVSFDKKTFDTTQRQGLELLIQHQKGSSAEPNTNSISTLGKIALSGKMDDVAFSVRGVKDNEPVVSTLGFKNGTNGLAMRVSANLDENLAIQLGGGDTGTKDGLRLSGWKNIAGNYNATTNVNGSKSIDSGNVYFNIVKGADTQTLPENTRLTRTAAQITAAQSELSFGRSFRKEFGDTSTTTPFGTSGAQFISKEGFVVDTDGKRIRAYSGLTANGDQGIINSEGKRVSISGANSAVKDGLVAGDSYTANYGTSAGGNSGRYRNIFAIDETTGNRMNVNTGTGQAARANEGFYRAVCDNAGGGTCTAGADGRGSGGSNSRGNRYIRVWENAPNGPGNVLAAGYNGDRFFNPGQDYLTTPDGTARVGTGGDLNQYQKAVDLNTGYILRTGGNGNNLTNLDPRRFYINDNLEVVDRDGRIYLRRHEFNNLGFLIRKDNGNYVNELSVNINANNQLVFSKPDGTEVKRIQLATFNPNALIPTQTADYSQTTDAISGGITADKSKQSISINVRDMSIQGLATKTTFFEKKTGQAERTDTQNWAMSPVLYNVNANVLLFPKKLTATSKQTGYTQAGDAIGYKLVATTQGSNGDSTFKQENASRTSGLLIINPDSKDATKTRYWGARHLDSLTKAQGDIQITGDGIAFTANDLLFAFRGELATGVIPDAGQVFGSSDRLFILQGKLKGDLQAKIIPSNEGLGFDTTLTLVNNGYYGDNTGVRIVLPEGNGSLAMGDLTGTVQAEGTINTKNIATDPNANFEGALNLKGNVKINPKNTATADMRIRNVGFSATPLSGTTDQFSPYQDTRMGELALTKHDIYTNMTIRGTN